METTYTPLGDENSRCAARATRADRNNLHPARGRKPHAVAILNREIAETTHTPSGDENLHFASAFCSAMRNNLRPARGRKKLLTHVDKEQKEIDTYETYFI